MWKNERVMAGRTGRNRKEEESEEKRERTQTAATRHKSKGAREGDSQSGRSNGH